MNKMMENLNDKLKSKVLKAGIAYVIGSILLKGIAFFSTPLFSNLMTTSEYGAYGTYLSYESIINIVIALGVPNSIRNAAIDYREDINSYITSMLLLITIPFVLLLLIFNVIYCLGFTISGFSTWVINILVCHSFASAVIEIISISFSIKFKSNQYLAISFSCSVLNILLSVVLMLTILKNDRFFARVIGLGCTYFLIAAILYLKKIFITNNRLKKEYCRYALKIGMPMITFYMGYSLLNTFDRVMISNMCGNSKAGIYSFAYNIANILNIIVTAIFTAWVPWFYEKMENKAFETIHKNQRIIIDLVLVGSIVFILASPEFIRFMAPASYSDGSYIVPILIGGMYMIFVYNFLGYTELFYKKTLYLTIGTWGATVINIALNYYFINEYGYFAAAYTTFVSFLLLFILHRIIVQIKFGKNHVISTCEDIKSIFVLSFFILVTVILKDRTIARYALLLCVIICELLFIWRKECSKR